jgi:hypothetical protein
MSVRDHASRGFARLPPGVRRQVLHRLGRYSPWEPGFDFTPPPLAPGEEAGPPDFVGIGVQKAGTTWWYDLILTHPGVSSPAAIHKERHFLDRFGTEPFGSSDIDRYHGWFPRTEGMVAGEWTPDYITYSWAPQLLKKLAPRAHLIVLLRDPVERFRSGLAHQKRMGSPGGGAAIEGAVQRGFYHRALDTWMDHFDQARLLILQYERCALDPVGQLGDTFRFLGLSEFQPAGLHPVDHRQPEDRTDLAPEVKDRLIATYESDVVALTKRVPNLDLSLWPNFSYLAGARSPGEGESNSPTRRA